MPIPTYTPGYPPDGSSLGQTKSTVRNNLDGTFETVAIDHINNNGQPGSQPAGYHTVIHEVTQTSVNTVANYNQIFSGIPGTLVVNAVTTAALPPGGDTQLYSLSGAGILSQLTGRVASTAGYCWSSGILIQWSIVGSTPDNATITFPVPFPNNCFTVVATPVKSGSLGNLIFTLRTVPSQSSFQVRTNGVTLDAVTYVAIGN